MAAIICAIMLAAVSPGDAYGRPIRVGDFSYNILSETDKTVEVASYSGQDPVVNVPSTVTIESTEYTVTSIKIIAKNEITKANIPSTVTELQTLALFRSFNLEEVVFEEGSKLTVIGDFAFDGCENLHSINIPTSVEGIGRFAFRDCRALENITWPSELKEIGDGAFYNCNFSNIVFPSKLVTIGKQAFYTNRNLASVAFPASLTTIGESAFVTGTGGMLSSIQFSEGLEEIGASAFSRCGLTELVLPNTVKKLDAGCFNSSENLTSIKIPASLESIGRSCFAECHNLSSVDLAGKGFILETDFVFGGCRTLTSIKIPDTTTRIGNAALQMTGLTELLIPASVTEIGQNAFAQTALTSVLIPDNVKVIGANAFAGCKQLESFDMGKATQLYSENPSDGKIGGILQSCEKLKNVTISPEITELPTLTFANCTSLERVIIPANVTTIDVTAFNGCSALQAVDVNAANTVYASVGGAVYKKDMSEIVFCPPALRNYVVPEGVRIIGNRGLAGFIGEEITVTEGVVEIGDEAFYGCPNLKKVSIPATVTSIGEAAFANNPLLEEVAVAASNTVYSSTGKMIRTTDDKEIFWCAPSFTEAVIEDGTKSIGAWAFNNWKGTAITIPASVKEICKYAFSGAALTSIDIPEGVTAIGERAFDKCPLATISIPASVETLGNMAFSSPATYTEIKCHWETLPDFPTDNYFYYPFGQYWEYPFSEETGFQCKLYVPKGTKDKYIANPVFNRIWGNRGDAGLASVIEFGTSGIEDVQTSETIKCEIGRYDLNGLTVGPDHKGIVIVRYSDGSSRKEIVR